MKKPRIKFVDAEKSKFCGALWLSKTSGPYLCVSRYCRRSSSSMFGTRAGDQQPTMANPGVAMAHAKQRADAHFPVAFRPRPQLKYTEYYKILDDFYLL